jgi:serine/threonine protein kinase
MKYLHQLDIIHRDLKSSNILIVNISNCAKITDFGQSVRKLQENSSIFLIDNKLKNTICSTVNDQGYIFNNLTGTLTHLAPEGLLHQFHLKRYFSNY